MINYELLIKVIRYKGSYSGSREMEIKDDWVYITGFERENEVYGLVVFDEHGKEIFKTSERMISASLAGDLLVYKTAESQKNYAVRLP
ncbi:MAG: hypothetical protein ACOX2N_09490 [Peptococcia bacterium]|jgi:hypothetical protein